ncbi:228_t:CDS:2, partial [Dentiscutata erythropus]
RQQQFYSNADINRLVEEQIISREKQSLKPKQISQVDPNTEAVKQFIEIIKQAKKTLAKKPGPGKEKADKIHIDHFLDDFAKVNPDHNSSDA